jgi:sarcosine oxidase subunit beta
MSNPNQAPGFDESVDEDWELVHMEAAIKRLPLLAKAGRLAHWAGLYEVTPDAHPIYGAVPGLDGYYVVTGFSGHGFMHGPISGLLMAEIILDGQSTTLDVSRLDYQRFAEDRLIHEYNVVRPADPRIQCCCLRRNVANTPDLPKPGLYDSIGL